MNRTINQVIIFGFFFFFFSLVGFCLLDMLLSYYLLG